MLGSGSLASRPAGPDPRLDAARGAVREALSAIRNLEQLLKSVRVGPRALAPVIPDVAASCGELDQRVELLLAAVQQRLAGSPEHHLSAIAELRAFVRPRTDELGSELAASCGRVISARVRLEFEALVERLGNELDAARVLVDLLDAAAWGRGMQVNLLELVRESFRQRGPEPRSPFLDVTLSSSVPDLELTVNPRVLAQLFALSASIVALQGGTAASITISRSDDGGALVRVAPAPLQEEGVDPPPGRSEPPGGSEYIRLSPVPAASPARGCVRVVAELSGARLHFDDVASVMEFTWPSAACSS